MSRSEKLKLQIMFVQIKLLTLQLYNGAVDGVLNAKTRSALKLFQKVKDLPETGTMTTPTLNALGVPSVT
jgi:His-Xaa-Ser repeat protein HxsA